MGATREPSTDSSGLIADGSPQHGAGVTWTDAWIVDETRDEPIVSGERAGFDALFLTDAATGNATVSITVEGLPSSDPDELLTSDHRRQLQRGEQGAAVGGGRRRRGSADRDRG